MKKTLSILLIFVLVLTCFTGCGGSSSSDDVSEIVIWTELTYTEAQWQILIDEWEAANPDVKVTVEIIAGADRIQKIALAKEANELPNIYVGATFSFIDEAFLGNIAPITDVVEPLESVLNASTYALTKINGEHYAMPFYSTTFGLLYNADSFRAAGLEDYVVDGIANWTLDEYENVILPALADYVSGTEKYALFMFAGNEQADTYHHNLLHMYGGDVLIDGEVVAADDADTVAALETIIEWYELGYTNSNAVTKQGQESAADFQAQISQITFGQYLNYTTNNAAMASGAIDYFDMRIAVQPTEDGKGVAASYVYSAFVMDTGSDAEIELAKELLAFAASNENCLNFINSGGIPAFTNVDIYDGETAALMEEYAAIDNLIYDFTGASPGYTATRAYLFPVLQAALARDMTAAEALSEYQASANAVIAEYTANSTILK